jgi:nitrate reductase (NAD(P)H)
MATITQTISQQQSVLEAPHKLYPTVTSLSLSDEQTDSDIISVESESLPEIPLPPPSKAPTEILSVDKDTPDNNVPRDPRLIRLTGVHPFNVEPPLTTLFNEGMGTIHNP